MMLRTLQRMKIKTPYNKLLCVCICIYVYMYLCIYVFMYAYRRRLRRRRRRRRKILSRHIPIHSINIQHDGNELHVCNVERLIICKGGDAGWICREMKDWVRGWMALSHYVHGDQRVHIHIHL